MAIRSTVIKSFRHEELRKFFETGSIAGIQPAHAAKLARMLARLDQAKNARDMNVPAWRLHPLKGKDLKGHYSVSISGNWRMTFMFDGGHAVLVDNLDYH